jgi:hypothetical protein
MNITITLTEDEFPKQQQNVIQSALGLQKQADLDGALKKLCKAAALEYVNMFVEEGMPSSADEVRQERLRFLIENYYRDHIPSESEVTAIFQLTKPQSRTLLSKTISRHRNKIGGQVRTSVAAVIRSAKKSRDGGTWEIVIQSEVILEELNRAVAEKGPTLKRIRLKRGSAGQYEVEEDTYNLLKNEYGIG